MPRNDRSLRDWRTNALTRFGSYKPPTDGNEKRGLSTATRIRSACATPRRSSATSPETYSAAYVERLLAHILIDTDEPADADFVIYFDGDTIQYSGIWMGGRVLSKWGTGHLWEHALHEVSLRYGAELRFFHSVPPERCIAEFVAFARGE
jgi:hypothetical protein